MPLILCGQLHVFNQVNKSEQKKNWIGIVESYMFDYNTF
jgi:hypothetical protein